MSEHRDNEPIEPASTENAATRSSAPGASPEAGSVLEAELPRMRQELQSVRSELESRDRRLDELARAYSSLLNDQKEFRGRLEREKDRVLEADRSKIVTHLLQISDELERALSAAHEDQGPLAKGVRLIHEGLSRTLVSMGLERLSLVGQPFDPNLAEVLDVVPVKEVSADGHVLEEITPCFKLGSRVLRPARVRVARHVPTESKASSGDGAGAPLNGASR